MVRVDRADDAATRRQELREHQHWRQRGLPGRTESARSGEYAMAARMDAAETKGDGIRCARVGVARVDKTSLTHLRLTCSAARKLEVAQALPGAHPLKAAPPTKLAVKAAIKTVQRTHLNCWKRLLATTIGCRMLQRVVWVVLGDIEREYAAEVPFEGGCAPIEASCDAAAEP